VSNQKLQMKNFQWEESCLVACISVTISFILRVFMPAGKSLEVLRFILKISKHEEFSLAIESRGE
jgi:hypothetical protein